MDRAVLILVAQAAVSGSLLTDRRVFAAVVDGGGGGGSGPTGGNDPIARAVSLMRRVINTNDLVIDLRKRHRVGPWQAPHTPDGINHDLIAKVRSRDFDRDAFVAIARDHITNCEALYRHLTDNFEADRAARPEVAKLFEYTWDSIPLLTTQQLRTMLSTVIPIAMLRQLFQGFRLDYVHGYSPEFFRLAVRYRPIVCA